MAFPKFYSVALLVGGSMLPMMGPSPAAAAQSSSTTAAHIQAEADAMLKASYPADGPGAAVVIMKGGKIIYAGSRGLADVQAKRPITPGTAFPVGSIAKQFTAAAVLKLVADGKISLDDPVTRFFPNWPQPAGSATVRQLLNHSSGIQDFSKVPGWIAKNRDRPWTTEQLLAVFLDLPPKAKPGAAWEYNNGGYVLLGAIVEKVAGKPWHEVIAERVFRPLGLTSMNYADRAQGIADLARGYTKADGKLQLVQRSSWSVAHAAGGLVGSVEDMAAWARALHGGKLLPPELYREMTSPARLADGSTQPYGFGLRLQKIRGKRSFVHGGAGAGLDTDSVYVPSEDLFVAVFANSDEPATDPSTLTRRLAALAMGRPIPSFARADVPASEIAPLFGAYGGGAGPAVNFFASDDKLYLSRGETRMEAIPAGGDRFFFGSDVLLWARFQRQPDGAHVLEVHEPAEAAPMRLVRTGDVPAPLTVAPEVLRSYVGTYKTETLPVAVALDGNGRLTLTPAGQDTMPLRPVSATEFRIDGTPMRLEFHPENGKVDRFTLHRGARALHGTRVTE